MTTQKRAPRKRTARATRARRAAAPPATFDSQLRQLWLAGLGAVATTGETAVVFVDGLVARGKKREPAAIAAAERAVRDARGAVESLAAEAGRRSRRMMDDAIERLGVKSQPRSRNFLHRLGDVAEALL